MYNTICSVQFSRSVMSNSLRPHVTVSTISPSICHEVMRPDAMILVFWILSFKPAFSLPSFTFIKRLFSSSLLSAIRVLSSAYLRLLIFLLTILIPACTSSSLTFHMMYSAYKWNKQDDNMTLFCFSLSTTFFCLEGFNSSLIYKMASVSTWLPSPSCSYFSALDFRFFPSSMFFSSFSSPNLSYPMPYYRGSLC